jgi:hypothetical protein
MKPVICCRAFILTIIFALFACAGMPHRFTLEMRKENDRWLVSKETCY